MIQNGPVPSKKSRFVHHCDVKSHSFFICGIHAHITKGSGLQLHGSDCCLDFFTHSTPSPMDTPEHVWGKPTKVNLLNLITNTDLLEKPMLLSVQMQGNDNVRNIVPPKKCKVLLLFYWESIKFERYTIKKTTTLDNSRLFVSSNPLEINCIFQAIQPISEDSASKKESKADFFNAPFNECIARTNVAVFN